MTQVQANKSIPIFMISGGKGIAGHTMIESLIIQYPDNNLNVKVVPDIQTAERITEVIIQVKRENGILCHTMVNSELRRFLKQECEKMKVRQIDFMGELADFIENDLGLKSIKTPGLYRRINAQYFERIEAIEFTLNHDDGLSPTKLNEAEIVLTGVSRSGKTPLSVYMSMFGWKVANVPLVKGIDPPEELFKIDPRRVFGLSISLNHLIAQRYKRLVDMKNLSNEQYIDKTAVAKELQYANFIFSRGGFTTINITDKAIETTANEIIGLISDRFNYDKRKNRENVD